MTRILLDADGCFLDFITPALRVADIYCGVKSSYERIVIGRMELDMALTPEQTAQWMSVMRAEGYCRSMKPYPGAQQCVEELKSLGDVYFITAQFPNMPHWMYEREAALLEHFDIPYKRVIHTHAKYVASGDILVEDLTTTIKPWLAEHTKSYAIRIDRPYNARDEVPERCFTVNNYDDLIAIVRGLTT